MANLLKICQVVLGLPSSEHCIARHKNWKILAKGYRGRLAELPTIIRIVTQLKILRTQ